MITKLMKDMYFLTEERMDQKLSKPSFHNLRNMTVSQLEYLGVIRDGDQVTGSDLAKELGYANSSVTVMIKRLTEMGLVEKEPSEEDKRVTYIVLTDLGRQVVDAHMVSFEELGRIMETVLEPEEQEVFSALLQKGLEAYGKSIGSGQGHIEEHTTPASNGQ